MRNADAVLGIIRERGKQGWFLEDIYRQLFNPDLYVRAYGRIYSNDGSMTPGITGETADEMSQTKIEKLINEIRYERHQWTPVRRTYIPKENGKLRPLGIPSWSNKLLQDVMRSILEAYYEPQFSDHSHGFRPERGCHTALGEIVNSWTGAKWFIEGDISKCFDSLDHRVLMSILKEKLHDNRFLRSIQGLLQAGYMEDWKSNQTLSGSPQGGVVSPILSNIYLDKLDKYVEQVLIPEYTSGQARKLSKQYETLSKRLARRKKNGNITEAKALLKQLQQMPSVETHDPDFRRLHYVRYADDFLLGFTGPKVEAEEIKCKIRDFLKDTLKLELSQEKTLITHATEQAARLLGYQITVQQSNDRHDQNGRRSINGIVALRLPVDVVETKCAEYMQKGKPVAKTELIHDEDYSIVAQYQSELRGVYQFYQLATNVGWLNKLKWVMETSLLKTLARKHQTTTTAIAQKHSAQIKTSQGTYKCLEVIVKRDGKKPLVARFGGLALKRQRQAILIGRKPMVYSTGHNELIKRLLADRCEICEAMGKIEIHHIRKLADLETKGRREKPIWIKQMAARKRKTLAVCISCHKAIHMGKVNAAGLK